MTDKEKIEQALEEIEDIYLGLLAKKIIEEKDEYITHDHVRRMSEDEE